MIFLKKLKGFTGLLFDFSDFYVFSHEIFTHYRFFEVLSHIGEQLHQWQQKIKGKIVPNDLIRWL